MVRVDLRAGARSRGNISGGIMTKIDNRWSGEGFDNSAEPYFRCRLKELLKANGLTQKDVADILGCSSAYMSMIVNGHYIPRADRMYIIAGILGVDHIDEIWVFNNDIVPILSKISAEHKRLNKLQGELKETLDSHSINGDDD